MMMIHRWLDFKVTRRCNNFSKKCAYCSVDVDPPDSKDILAIADIHRVLEDSYYYGFDTFWILGGEPTLRSDIEEIFDPIADLSDVAITLVTNGKVPCPKAYESLFSTRANRAYVQVSLDSLNSANFKRACPAASLALVADISALSRQFSTDSHQCGIEIHCVISRENITDFDEFGRFFAAKQIPVSYAMVCPWSLCEKPSRYNEFTRLEAESIARRIDGLRTGLGVDSFNPLVAEFIREQIVGFPDCSGRPCGAGLTHLVINGDGNVFRCISDSFQSDRSLGNILNQRLHNILSLIDSPSRCSEDSRCFDGFAWDRLAISN